MRLGGRSQEFRGPWVRIGDSEGTGGVNEESALMGNPSPGYDGDAMETDA